MKLLLCSRAFLLLGTFALVVCLPGCKRHEAEKKVPQAEVPPPAQSKVATPPPAQSKVATPPTEPVKATKPLVVQGLYIGMSVQELNDIAQSRFKKWHFKKITSGLYSFDRVNGKYGEIFIYIDDSKGRVNKIHFAESLSSDLFNAANFSAEQFAKAFSESFSIGTMNRRTSDRGNPFFESEVLPNKVLVRITGEKEVLLFYVENPEALKPRFN